VADIGQHSHDIHFTRAGRASSLRWSAFAEPLELRRITAIFQLSWRLRWIRQAHISVHLFGISI
jgi:hypothetical protein